MSINFAGEGANAQTMSSQTINYFDKRYLNVDEEIPQLKKVALRLKDLERKTHHQQMNIDDFRIKFEQNRQQIGDLINLTNTLKSEVSTMRTGMNSRLSLLEQKVVKLIDDMATVRDEQVKASVREDELKGKVSILVAKTADLDTSMNVLRTRISKNKDDVEQLQYWRLDMQPRINKIHPLVEKSQKAERDVGTHSTYLNRMYNEWGLTKRRLSRLEAIHKLPDILITDAERTTAQADRGSVITETAEEAVKKATDLVRN